MAVAHYPAEEMMPATPDHAAYLRATAAAHRAEATAAEATANQHRTEANNLEAIATAIETPTVPIPPVTPPTSGAPKGTFIQYQPTLGQLTAASMSGSPRARVIFNIGEARTTATLSSSTKAKVLHDLEEMRAARSNGAKVQGAIRFVYSYANINANADATPAIAIGHVQQLQPVLAPFIADGTVYALEAGFAGKWGEQHYAGYPGDTGPFGNNWYGNDWSRFMELYQAELDAFACPILIRFPRMFIHAIEVAKLRGSERLGIHIDSLLADAAWGGSLPSQGAPGEYNKLVTYMAQGRVAIGETENTSLSDAQLRTDADRMRALHFRGLNDLFNDNTKRRLEALSHPSGAPTETTWKYVVAGLQLA